MGFLFSFQDSYFVPSELETSRNVLSFWNFMHLEGESYSNALNFVFLIYF